MVRNNKETSKVLGSDMKSRHWLGLRWTLFIIMAAIGNLLCSQLYGQTNSVAFEEVTNKHYCVCGQWTRTSNTNCLIWNSFPKEGESATWSGQVSEGKASGKGMLQWFTNGIPTTAYVGEMRAGMADGHGVSKWTEIEFEGEWAAGSLNCKRGVIRFKDGNWYKGEIKNGFKSGHGEELLKGGGSYVGEFEKDRFSGLGIMTLPSGDRIEGQWRDSKLQGVGTYLSKNGQAIQVKQTEAGIVRN